MRYLDKYYQGRFVRCNHCKRIKLRRETHGKNRGKDWLGEQCLFNCEDTLNPRVKHRCGGYYREIMDYEIR